MTGEEIRVISLVTMKRFITTHWLVILLFFFIFFVRLYHIGADIPSARWSLSIEEVFSGYNARSKIIYDDWTSEDMGGFRPFYAPLSSILLYSSFKFFGIGILQMRVPYALLTSLTFILFYMLVLREYGTKYALLITTQFGLLYWVVIWNRSALHQNLSLLFVVIVMLLLQRMQGNFKDSFLTGIVLPCSILIKIDHIVVSFAGLLAAGYFFVWKRRGEERKSAFLGLSAGIFAGICVVIYLLWITGGLSTFSGYLKGFVNTDLYSKPFGEIGTKAVKGWSIFEMSGDWSINGTFIKWLLLSYWGSADILDNHWGIIIGKAIGNVLIAAPRIFMEIDPFGFVLFCVGALIVWEIYQVRRLTPVEAFSVILIITFIFFLTPIPLVFFKRLIYVLPAIYFLIASFWKELDTFDTDRGDQKVDNWSWKGLLLIIIVSLWLIFLFASASLNVDIFVVPRFNEFKVIQTIWLHLSNGYILAVGFYGGILIAVVLYMVGVIKHSYPTRSIRSWFKSLVYLSIIISILLVTFEVVFPPAGHRYAAQNFSRRFADLFGGEGRIAVLDHYVFRLSAFHTDRLRFLLCQSGFSKCPDKKDISYLVVTVLEGYTPYPEIKEDINKAFPDAVLVDEYSIIDPLYTKPFIVKVFSVKRKEEVLKYNLEPKIFKLGT